MKERIISLTSKDFVWDFVRGRGKGGQKRNKTCSAVRCSHKASGSLGWCEGSRSQTHNRREAFLKCVQSDKFQKWLRIQIAKKNCHAAVIEDEVDKLMHESNLKIEVFPAKEPK